MRTIIAMIVFSLAPPLWAHCDSLKGPVIAAARQALAKGDITPVLKWVRPADEADIRSAFAQTMTVRAQSPAAQELADRWFFETLVRAHRAGEGEPYEGLKGEDYTPEKGIEMADAAVDGRSLDAAEKTMIDAVRSGLRRRFDAVQETKAHANDDVESGRRYVHAYVEFIHYVERLHQDATADGGHHTD